MSGPEVRTPFHGECADCEHVWVLVWLPLEARKASEIMMGARCPKCGSPRVYAASKAKIEAAGVGA